MKTPHWKVNAMIERDRETWEISVLRSDNVHGQKSYGWFDKTKLLISTDGNNPGAEISKSLEAKLRKVAQECADELNALPK